MPFEAAAGDLRRFLNVWISSATERRQSEAAGAAYVAIQDAEVERLEREAPEPPQGPPLQHVSADGAMVPLVGGKWAQVRTLAIGTVVSEQRAGEPPSGEAHATELSYFSRMTDAASFIRLAQVEVHRRGTETAGTVAGLQDGADWEQRLLDRYRPDAVRILDFPHGLAHLNHAAQATFGAGSATSWLGAQARTLKHGDPAEVLAAVHALPVAAAPDPAAATEARDTTLGYLEKRRDQLRYAELLAAGYPIGSGLVASANKLVVEVRLKGSGMHWAAANVNPMLALRTIVCSERWDQAWPQIARQLRAEVQTRRAARRQARRAAAPVASQAPTQPPLRPTPRPAPSPRSRKVVNGRPTSQHPWRRPFLQGGPARSAS